MLVDSSKVNKNTPYNFATLGDINSMVVDGKFDGALKEKIKEKGVKVY